MNCTIFMMGDLKSLHGFLLICSFPSHVLIHWYQDLFLGKVCNDGKFINYLHISYIQGLTWYAKRLRVDEDGDVAEQFLEEVVPEMPTSTTDHHKPSFPRFQINNRNRPAKVENQVILQEGKLQQRIQHQGRLLLVWSRKKPWEMIPSANGVGGWIYLFICPWWSTYEDDLSDFDDKENFD